VLLLVTGETGTIQTAPENTKATYRESTRSRNYRKQLHCDCTYSAEITGVKVQNIKHGK
jgi:hypothetical protein